uniref:Protein kinase domain-containing protein n=2 Tax=Heterorhabditis bacteriophora TaxID=37862 RepID=A0A1I7XJH6_HETBA
MNSMQRNEMSPSNKRVDPMCQSSRPESVGSENRETVSNSSLKELRQIQTSAQIPPGVMLGMSSAPTIHSTKCGNVEYIVVDCPQFIPESVIQKNTDRTPKNINYTPGKLLRDPNGATVFHANISETDASRRCQNMNTYQADARSQERIGSFASPLVNTPCEIEVNEKGMPEITLLEDVNSMPKSKRAAVGVMTKDNRNDFVTISKTRTDRVKATVNGLEPESEGTRSQPVEASVLVKSILSGKLPANICKNITNTEVSEVASAGVHSSTNERTEMVKRDFMGEGIDGAGVGVDSDSGGARWKSAPGKIIVSGTTDAKSRVLENNDDSPAGRLVGTDGGGTGLKVNCSAGKETSEEGTYKRNANMKNSAKGETSSASITGKNSCKSSGNTNIPRFDVGASGSLGGSASTRNDISCYAIGNAAYQISRNISSGASRGGHSYVTPGTSGKKGGIQKYEKPDNVNKKDCSVYMLPPGFK